MDMKNRMYCVMVLMTALFLSAAPCFAGGKSEPSTTAQGPFVITMLNTYFSAEPPPPDHEIYKMIERETGAAFDITWVPAAGYTEKIILTLASQDYPMVLNGKEETRKPNMIEAQRAGIFWELTDKLLSQCPLSLGKLNPDINRVLSVDGKLYTLYQERPIGREAVILRTDWLKKLNLPEPRTVQQLDQVVRAFAARDPDGNGKNDTYGLFLSEPYVSTNLPDWLCIANGGANVWEVKNGKFIPSFTTQPYLDGLDLMRAWYKDKVLNQDFIALKAVQDVHDAFMAQKSGIFLPFGLDDALKLDGLFAVAPGAVIGVQATMLDKNGKEFVKATTGHNGGLFFPKKAVKDEAALLKILKVFDVINDKDGDIFQAMIWGLKDRHYTLDAQGRINQTQEQKQLRNREINNFIQLRTTYDFWAYDSAKVVVSDLQAAVFEGWKRNVQFAVVDPSLPLISNTYVEKGNQLDNIRRDAVSKYVMGAIDLNGYRAEIQRWLDAGGSKVITELEEGYKKAGGK
jgi:putative aldouronate transport system substrate-binding protein